MTSTYAYIRMASDRDIFNASRNFIHQYHSFQASSLKGDSKPQKRFWELRFYEILHIACSTNETSLPPNYNRAIHPAYTAKRQYKNNTK